MNNVNIINALRLISKSPTKDNVEKYNEAINLIKNIQEKLLIFQSEYKSKLDEKNKELVNTNPEYKSSTEWLENFDKYISAGIHTISEILEDLGEKNYDLTDKSPSMFFTYLNKVNSLYLGMKKEEENRKKSVKNIVVRFFSKKARDNYKQYIEYQKKTQSVEKRITRLNGYVDVKEEKKKFSNEIYNKNTQEIKNIYVKKLAEFSNEFGIDTTIMSRILLTKIPNQIEENAIIEPLEIQETDIEGYNEFQTR